MFHRIRASIAGEPVQPPEKSPQSYRQTLKGPGSEQAPPEKAAGFLPSFLTGGADRDLSGASRSSPHQEHRPSFFGGFLPQAPSPSPDASPHTIRASAAALLKLATPPPLNNASKNGQDRKTSLNGDIDDVVNQRESLEHQISRRDQYISHLQHDLQKMQSQLSQFQKDNSTLRRQQLESTHRHSIVTKLWRRTNDGLRARVECFENETTPAAAREIANLIRDAAPPNKDSAYLMMLQDQLTKANAKLDHLGSQTEIVLHKGEEVVESLREEMNEVIRERCRMELELLDQERMLEDDMRRMVVKTERRLKRVQGEIDFLEMNAVEVLKNQEEDEEETESESHGEEIVEKGEDEEQGADDEPDRDNKSSQCIESNGGANAEKKEKNPEATKGAPNDGKISIKQQSPDTLRKELRKIATERDRCLSVLQKKLREKNEEFHNLVQLRENHEKAIKELETEKQDREQWEMSRREEFTMP